MPTRQILVLYEMLVHVAPNPVARLNRAVALRHVHGTEAALAEVDALADELGGYHLFHAIRGDMLDELGSADAARAAKLRALELTNSPAEQALLRRRAMA